jgi:hypothetical protein
MIEQFLASFWGKTSVFVGGIFGVVVISFLVNSYLLKRKELLLKRILEQEKKNGEHLTELLHVMKKMRSDEAIHELQTEIKEIKNEKQKST